MVCILIQWKTCCLCQVSELQTDQQSKGPEVRMVWHDTLTYASVHNPSGCSAISLSYFMIFTLTVSLFSLLFFLLLAFHTYVYFSYLFSSLTPQCLMLHKRPLKGLGFKRVMKPLCISASWGSLFFRAQHVSDSIQRSHGGQTPQHPAE